MDAVRGRVEGSGRWGTAPTLREPTRAHRRARQRAPYLRTGTPLVRPFRNARQGRPDGPGRGGHHDPTISRLGRSVPVRLARGVADAGRTKLCHVSPGAQPQTIEVTQPADVQLHLPHGDVTGSCTDPAVCSAVCDDHNACTVNDGVQTKGGCTCRPQAVTCVQDANFCTAEICNPARAPATASRRTKGYRATTRARA